MNRLCPSPTGRLAEAGTCWGRGSLVQGCVGGVDRWGISCSFPAFGKGARLAQLGAPIFLCFSCCSPSGHPSGRGPSATPGTTSSPPWAATWTAGATTGSPQWPSPSSWAAPSAGATAWPSALRRGATPSPSPPRFPGPGWRGRTTHRLGRSTGRSKAEEDGQGESGCRKASWGPHTRAPASHVTGAAPWDSFPVGASWHWRLWDGRGAACWGGTGLGEATPPIFPLLQEEGAKPTPGGGVPPSAPGGGGLMEEMSAKLARR